MTDDSLFVRYLRTKVSSSSTYSLLKHTSQKGSHDFTLNSNINSLHLFAGVIYISTQFFLFYITQISSSKTTNIFKRFENLNQHEQQISFEDESFLLLHVIWSSPRQRQMFYSCTGADFIFEFPFCVAGCNSISKTNLDLENLDIFFFFKTVYVDKGVTKFCIKRLYVLC